MTKNSVNTATKSILKPTLKLPCKTLSLNNMREKIKRVCTNTVICDGHKYEFNPVLKLYVLQKLAKKVSFVQEHSASIVHFLIRKPNNVPNDMQKYIVGEELSLKISYQEYIDFINRIKNKYSENYETAEKHIRIQINGVEKQFINWTALIASAKTNGLVS